MGRDSSKVVKAGAGYLIGNLLIKGITFLSAPIFSRLLTPEEMGMASIYFSYESIIYILLGLALHSSVNSAKLKYKEKIDDFMSSIILISLISLLIWLVLGNLLFPVYTNHFEFGRLILNVLLIHSFSTGAQQIYNVYVGLTYSYKEFVKISWTYAISNIALSVLLILTIFGDDRTTGRIIGASLPMIFIGAYIVIFFFRKARPTVRMDYISYAVRYSLPIIPHGLSQIVLNSFDRIMIKRMVGATEAGIYSFAYTVYSIFMVVFNSLQNVWKPWVFDRMDKKDYAGIRDRGNDYVLGMALFTGVVVLLAPEVIMILGDKSYWDASECVVPIVIGGFFAFLYTLPSLIEYFYEKTKFIAIGTTASAIINIGLNYIFIPQYGYVAAAYTTLVTYLLYFVFHYLVAIKVHGQSIFDTKRIVVISSLVMLCGVISIAAKDLLLIRLVCALIITGFLAYWGEKKFDIFQKISNRFQRR